jgi:phosphatidylglycerol:prolipoprotein diacylglycerol transferase
VYPSFGEVFGEPVPAYFTMLMLGFAVAIYSVVRWAKKVGVDHQSVIDCGLASILGGILGGRLLHVLADGYFWDYVHLCTDPKLVGWHITQAQCRAAEGVWDAAARVCRPAARDCLAWAKFYNGGLAYYGGLVFGAWGAAHVARRDGLPVLKLADITFIGVAFGLFAGRIGCFLGGCCYGLPTEHRFGLAFPAWSPASEGQFREGLLSHPGQPSLPVHPTQLYEALGCLAIALVLNAWGPRHKRFDGHIALAFLVLYAVLRFGLEFLRADDRGLFLGVSTSQWISIVIVGAALVIGQKLALRTRRALAS